MVEQSKSYRVKNNVLSAIFNFSVVIDWHILNYVVDLGLVSAIKLVLGEYTDPSKFILY